MLSTFTGSFGFGRRNAIEIEKGSVDLTGLNGSFLKVNNDAAFAPGLGDFTIEWWQYADTYTSYPRIMSIGTYSTSPMIAISLEGADNANRSMFLWVGGIGSYNIGSVGVTLNTWVHFAVVRESGVVKLYKDGVNLSGAGISIPHDAVYVPTHYFAIGTETSNGSISYGNSTFNGRITGFHYVVGSALYTTDFSVPTSNPTATANTELLLNFTTSANFLVDESDNPKTVTAMNFTYWSPLSPF